MTYEIKSGIPAPDVRNAGRPTRKYPFSDMQVGDSFFVDIQTDEDAPTLIARLRSNVNRWKKSDASVEGSTFRVALYTADGQAVPNPMTGALQVGVWRVQ